MQNGLILDDETTKEHDGSRLDSSWTGSEEIILLWNKIEVQTPIIDKMND
jgi:hypothetical protein